MNLCPCQSKQAYDKCCGPFIKGERNADTPEALMRSRYTAYSQANITYVSATMMGPAINGFDKNAAAAWSQQSEWLGLSILDAPKATDETGFVEFAARFKCNGKVEVLHERSEFRKVENRWFYYNGHTSKVGRNDPCPCDSGHKFKKCCGAA